MKPLFFDDFEQRKRIADRMLRDAILMLIAFLALTALFHLAR